MILPHGHIFLEIHCLASHEFELYINLTIFNVTVANGNKPMAIE